MRQNRKPYVTAKTDRLGKVRFYYRQTWLENGKRRERFIPLPDKEHTAEFDSAYWSIRSGRAEATKVPAKNTWAELIQAYKASARYRKLAAGTVKEYNRVMEGILAKNASKSVSSMTRKGLLDVHAKLADTPRKADWYIQVFRLLLNFAIKKLDWKVVNVAEGIDLYGKQREFEAWPDWLVVKLGEAPRNVRTAAELILNTGQRPNAAITMRRDQFSGEWMLVTDEKGAEQYEIHCPTELRDYIEGLPIEGAFIISKNLTEGLGYDSIEKEFRKWRNTLGPSAKKYTLHGLRKLACVRLAEAGCSDAQIQAITNQSAEMVAYYRKQASRKRLSKEASRLKAESAKNT